MFWPFKRATQKKPYRNPPLMVESLEERAVLSSFTVDGRCNIYGAGDDAPPAPGRGGGGMLPKLVTLSTLGSPSLVSFPAVTGRVSGWAAAGGYNLPDGGGSWGGVTNVPAWHGISGVRHDQATMFLVGVFLGPNGKPATAPPTLNVTDANAIAASQPLLGQQFFIGDGSTGGQVLQSVTVPAGATRLYLGFAENFGFRFPQRLPGYYSDNGGFLSVDVRSASASPSVRVSEGIDAPGTSQQQIFRISTADTLAVQMPNLTFVLRDLPVGTVPAALDVTWTTSVQYRTGEGTPLGAKPVPGFSFSVTRRGIQYQPAWPSVRGGDLDVTAGFTVAGRTYTVSSEMSFDTRSLRILGSNPTKAQVQAYVNSFRLPANWPDNSGYDYNAILRKIAYHETNLANMGSGGYNQYYWAGQFAGHPTWNTGGDRGVGVMQITPSGNDLIEPVNVWDWRANVAAGVAKLNYGLGVADRLPTAIRGAGFDAAFARVQAERRAAGLAPLVGVDVPTLTPLQRVRVAIRAYNGAAGTDSLGRTVLNEYELATTGPANARRLALTVNKTTRVGTAQWVEVPIARRSAGQPNYVNLVLASPDA